MVTERVAAHLAFGVTDARPRAAGEMLKIAFPALLVLATSASVGFHGILSIEIMPDSSGPNVRSATIRDALPGDLGAMFDIRGLVDENRMSRGELAALGLTEETVGARLGSALAGWVAEVDGAVVGYSMSDRPRGCVYAVFVLPAFQGRGLGSALLGRASAWLFESGLARIWLHTDPATRAYRFYLSRGWSDAGASQPSERRLELSVRTPLAATRL